MAAQLVHFLLVEDDDDHAKMVLRQFEKNHLSNTISRVADGDAALAYLKRQGQYADAPKVDVVLLDLNLPKVDGHEVLQIVKKDVELKNIPIVVLTTSEAEVDRAKAYGHHANSYLVKPVKFDDFKQMVHDLDLYWGLWNIPPQNTPGSGQSTAA